MFRPFVHFIITFLVPAACIYFFAYKSLDRISGLRIANGVLRDSLDKKTSGSTGDSGAIYQESIVRLRKQNKILGDSLSALKKNPVIKHDTVKVAIPVSSTGQENVLRDSLNRLTRSILSNRKTFDDLYSRYQVLIKEMVTKDCCKPYSQSRQLLEKLYKLYH